MPAAVTLCGAIAFGGCGESSEEKAKAQVCGARSDITKQVSTLRGLTPSAATSSTVKPPLEAIAEDLRKIKDAQPDLAPARRSEVESATQTFTAGLGSIAASLATGSDSGAAKAQLTASLSQLAAAYEQSLAPLDCP